MVLYRTIGVVCSRWEMKGEDWRVPLKKIGFLWVMLMMLVKTSEEVEYGGGPKGAPE